jgi:hypothetical protein
VEEGASTYEGCCLCRGAALAHKRIYKIYTFRPAGKVETVIVSGSRPPFSPAGRFSFSDGSGLFAVLCARFRMRGQGCY